MFVIDGLVWVVYVWLPEHLGVGALAAVVLVALFFGWRGSLALFPDKQCSRCKGAGSWGPGKTRRGCGKCGGRGRIPRVGSGH